MGGWGEKTADDYKIASSSGGSAETLGVQSRSLRRADGSEISKAEAPKDAPPRRPSPLPEQTDDAQNHKDPTIGLVSHLGVFILGLAISYALFEGPGRDLRQQIENVCSVEKIFLAQVDAMAELCGNSVDWTVEEPREPAPSAEATLSGSEASPVETDEKAEPKDEPDKD